MPLSTQLTCQFLRRLLHPPRGYLCILDYLAVAHFGPGREASVTSLRSCACVDQKVGRMPGLVSPNPTTWSGADEQAGCGTIAHRRWIDDSLPKDPVDTWFCPQPISIPPIPTFRPMSWRVDHGTETYSALGDTT